MVRKALTTASLKENLKFLASVGSCMIPTQSSEESQCPKYCPTSCRTYGLKWQQRLHLIFKNLFHFQKESKSQCDANDPVRTVIGKIPTVREAQLSQFVKSLDEPGCLLLTTPVLLTTWLTLC